MTAESGASQLHESVVRSWGREIVTGQLAPGTKLITDQVVVDRGVSRTVVREAIRVLESMGLVESTRRVGITVLPPERWNPLDPSVLRWRLEGPDRLETLRSLSELRSGIEPTAARLAATRATPEQCGRLLAAVIGMNVTARAANAEAYLAHDQDFHRTLLDASGNSLLAGMGEIVTAVLEGRTHHSLMPTIADPEALRMHSVIATAVQSGDGDAAEQAMRAIVAESATAIETIAGAGPA